MLLLYVNLVVYYDDMMNLEELDEYYDNLVVYMMNLDVWCESSCVLRNLVHS